MGFRGKTNLRVLAFIPFALNAGLIKPWKGFTPVLGKEKPGVIKRNCFLDRMED